MSAVWRQHFSFNKASQIGARALRASLKEDKRVIAEKRGGTVMRYQKWENGQSGEHTFLVPPPVPVKKAPVGAPTV